MGKSELFARSFEDLSEGEEEKIIASKIPQLVKKDKALISQMNQLQQSLTF